MDLNRIQRKQVRKQIIAHKHKDYITDIKLSDGAILKKFKVFRSVLRPEKMSAIFLARWLFFNNGLYSGKTVIDMGSGSGIQGVVCGLFGAKKVIFSDISKEAYKNSKENVKKFEIDNKSEIYCGDLFEKIKSKADIVIFNHPFFHDNSFEEHLKNINFVRPGNLIHKFFEEVKKYLNRNGIIIMPYFHLAGETNNPYIQGPKHGFSVKEAFRFNSTTGLQKGEISVYVLRAR